MTRSLLIVNTSNWDGEDYRVEIARGDLKEITTLNPGECVNVHSYAEPVELTVFPEESKTPEPFFDDEGEQITPQMTVEFK